MQLSKKRKTFSEYFWYFVNFFQCSTFSKKVTFRADVFLNLQTPKDVLKEISIESRFRGSLDK